MDSPPLPDGSAKSNPDPRVESRSERVSSGTKVNAVMRVLKGESPDAVSAELGVSIRRLERWRNEFVAAGSAELARRKQSSSSGWFRKNSGAILQWSGLLLVLVVVIAMLTLLLQRGGGGE